MNIGILTKPNCFSKKIISFLQKRKHTVVDVSLHIPSSLDLVISHGGDGTVLAAMHYAVKYNVPLYAIDLGTLGFLHSGNEKDFYRDFKNIETGKYASTERALLNISVGKKKYIALNDVVISSQKPGRLIHIDCFINKKKITTYPADGIIISSATGSTAYSLSCGGPLLDPEMKDMIITPIAPHILSQRSVIVKYDKIISLSSKEPSTVIIDGQKNMSSKECIISLSKKTLTIISHHKKDFFDVLKEKLCWGK